MAVSKYKLPLALIEPETVNSFDGVVFPIPTFPELDMKTGTEDVKITLSPRTGDYVAGFLKFDTTGTAAYEAPPEDDDQEELSKPLLKSFSREAVVKVKLDF